MDVLCNCYIPDRSTGGESGCTNRTCSGIANDVLTFRRRSKLSRSKCVCKRWLVRSMLRQRGPLTDQDMRRAKVCDRYHPGTAGA